jgi:NADPH:quinone reductase-like Zn-dependent oxidoreductase
VQLAREVGSRVIGTGRAADKDRALGLGVEGFVDLETDRLEDAGEADVVLDVILRGDPAAFDRARARRRHARHDCRTARDSAWNGRAIFFVVEADRSQLAELAQRLRDGRLTSNVGAVRPLAEAPAAFGPDAPRVSGKTIIQVTWYWRFCETAADGSRPASGIRRLRCRHGY